MCVCVCVCAHAQSVMSDSAALLRVAHQAPLSIGFSRQDAGAGCHGPPSGDLHNPETESMSLMSHALAGGFFTTSTTCESPIDL